LREKSMNQSAALTERVPDIGINSFFKSLRVSGREYERVYGKDLRGSREQSDEAAGDGWADGTMEARRPG
jgi:hypothetical protein